MTMQLFHRLTLIVSLAVLGAAIGSFGAGFLMPRNAGLAGGATVLMAGIAGLIGGAAAGLLAAVYAAPLLRSRMNMVVLPIAILLLAALAFKIWRSADQLKDPESAYSGLPSFRLAFEQTTVTDPGLATSISVDTSSRNWLFVLADGRKCTGGLRAKAQDSVGSALIAVHNKLASGEVCSGYDGSHVQELKWTFTDASGTQPEKRIELPPGCSETDTTVSQLVRTLRLIPSIAETKTTCN